MRRIIFVPIEPLEERYSMQWWNWFQTEFERLKIPYTFLATGVPLTDKIRQGSFLDVIGTNYYKSTQLQSICRMFENGEVQDNDSFLIADGWFPGIEMLAYIRNALGLKFKIFAIMHAGTYDPYDFITQRGMRNWGGHLERCWFRIYDGIFVATEFHKELILNQRKGFFEYQGHNNELTNKIHVTGLPIYPEFIKPTTYKENIIVFPHRLDPEKQPEIFSKLRTEFESNFKWSLVSTKEICKTKQEYYNVLNKSKISISCALQETYGIAMIESVLCGCVPVVPNRLSYKELYANEFRYDTYEELVEMVRLRIERWENWNERNEDNFFYQQQFFTNLGKNAIENMVKIMMEK
jgi:glycosyltransferase involved in cell wall biosynthesis